MTSAQSVLRLSRGGAPRVTRRTPATETSPPSTVAGANAKHVQRWLGHHSAAFTLAMYVHLLSGEVDAPLVLADKLQKGGNGVATEATGTDDNSEVAVVADLAA